jgi:hypothetical protein
LAGVALCWTGLGPFEVFRGAGCPGLFVELGSVPRAPELEGFGLTSWLLIASGPVRALLDWV